MVNDDRRNGMSLDYLKANPLYLVEVADTLGKPNQALLGVS